MSSALLAIIRRRILARSIAVFAVSAGDPQAVHAAIAETSAFAGNPLGGWIGGFGMRRCCHLPYNTDTAF